MPIAPSGSSPDHPNSMKPNATKRIRFVIDQETKMLGRLRDLFTLCNNQGSRSGGWVKRPMGLREPQPVRKAWWDRQDAPKPGWSRQYLEGDWVRGKERSPLVNHAELQILLSNVYCKKKKKIPVDSTTDSPPFLRSSPPSTSSSQVGCIVVLRLSHSGALSVHHL